MNPNHPISAYRIKRIKEVLDQQRMISHEIADKIGIDERWIKQYVDHLIDLKQVRIAKWCRMVPTTIR